MPTWLAIVALLGYGSLVLELTLLHVPSVASSRSLWGRSPAVVAGYSPAYRKLFAWSRGRKVLLLFVPLLAIYAAFLYPLAAIWGGADLLGDHAFATNVVTDALAAALIVVGRAVALGAVVAMRRSDGTQAEPALRTGGPFRYSRNPGLVGMYAFVMGLWVAAPSLAMLAAVGVYVVYMDFKVKMEEDYLRNRFGEAYVDYARRTSRYWP